MDPILNKMRTLENLKGNVEGTVKSAFGYLIDNEDHCEDVEHMYRKMMDIAPVPLDTVIPVGKYGAMKIQAIISFEGIVFCSSERILEWNKCIVRDKVSLYEMHTSNDLARFRRIVARPRIVLVTQRMWVMCARWLIAANITFGTCVFDRPNEFYYPNFQVPSARFYWIIGKSLQDLNGSRYTTSIKSGLAEFLRPYPSAFVEAIIVRSMPFTPSGPWRSGLTDDLAGAIMIRFGDGKIAERAAWVAEYLDMGCNYCSICTEDMTAHVCTRCCFNTLCNSCFVIISAQSKNCPFCRESGRGVVRINVETLKI